MTEEQKIKFAAHFLGQYGIQIDPDNEMLPTLFVMYACEKRIESLVARMEELSGTQDQKLDLILEKMDTLISEGKTQKKGWFKS